MRDHILLAILVLGGVPMIYRIVKDLFRGEIGADAIAAVSIITSLLLKEYLAGCVIVLMLATGEFLEHYAVRRASSVLNALLRRMPKLAHRKVGPEISDIAVEEVQINDLLVIFPHDISPVDGLVIEGHGSMDESYLTGEPFLMSKAPGSSIFSGAINGESALTIRATKLSADSRYAKITEIMRGAEERRPRLRRLGDQLGGIFTIITLVGAVLAWVLSHDPSRFLAVLVVATPCPLIIAIPVAVIGAISLSAKRGIIVKNPVALEQIQLCRTAIYDKTGTLTYGEPVLVKEVLAAGFQADDVLSLAASLERYSKHPLSQAIQEAAQKRKLAPLEAAEIHEKPGLGLEGKIERRHIRIVGRKQLGGMPLPAGADFTSTGGLECFVLVEEKLAARYEFRDAPRAESPSFIRHLGPSHAFEHQMIVSGDRASEVKYLADEVGITEVYAGKAPEEKLTLVRQETAKAKTLFIGDGINDAPALMAATVGVAIGQNSDITSEAADIVVLENSLRRVDEFMHIGERMRRIALECAIGGMILSLAGMVVAGMGHLPPIWGAITQEIIDVFAIANALRAAFPPAVLADM